MLFKPLLGTQLSGSVGGITASHNRGGAYFRQRATPTNPATPQQVTVRNAIAELGPRWNDVLTQAQRDGWNVYGDNVELTNRIGDAFNPSGKNMFDRSNVTAIQIAEPIQDDAPTIFNLGSFTEPVIGLADETGQDVEINFDNTDAWANETGSHMVVYISRPQNAGIKFFKGPYRFADTIDGDDTTAPTSPAVIAVPFPITSGQQLFVQIRVHRLDGRLSAIWRGMTIVSTAG